MIRRRTFLIAAPLAALASCRDFGGFWRDRVCSVYWIDRRSDRWLGIDIPGRNYLGRVLPRVTAVGDDERFVVAECQRKDSGQIEYYYIEKAKDAPYLNAEEITLGSFAAARFAVLKEELILPAFSKHF